MDKYNNFYFGFLLIVVGGSVFVYNAVFGVLTIIGGVLVIVLGTIFSRTRMKRLGNKRNFLQQQLHNLTPPLSQEKMINSLFKETVRKNDLRICPSCYSVYNNTVSSCNHCERPLQKM